MPIKLYWIYLNSLGFTIEVYFITIAAKKEKSFPNFMALGP